MKSAGCPRVGAEEKDKVRSVLKSAGAVGGSVHRADLSVYAGLPERVAREAVRALVLDGEPIVTLNDGYRFTTDASVLDAEVRSLKHRAAEILSRARALERHLTPQLVLLEVAR